MKLLIMFFWLFSMFYLSYTYLENNALNQFYQIKNAHPILSNRKINIDPTPSCYPDTEIIVSLVNGKSLAELYDNKDSVFLEIEKNAIKLDIPKNLKSKCLSQKDFKGKVFNAVKYDKKRYVEIKLENRNLAIYYFVFEYDNSGKFLKYYEQILVY